MEARIANRFDQERMNQMNYKSMQDRLDAQMSDRARQDQADFQQMRQRCEEDIPKMQSFINELMDNSTLNVYADNSRIEQIDLQAHKFLVLRKNEFCKVRILGSIPSFSNLKKQACTAFGTISGFMLTALATSAVAAISGLFIFVGSSLYAIPRGLHLMEREADDRTILEADLEELKGGLRFFKACQKAHLLRDGMEYNRFLGRISSTSSEKSWLPSLALEPSWESRITKIENELKNRGEDISATQEDQQKIALLEGFV
jgi:hypothetical protein